MKDSVRKKYPTVAEVTDIERIEMVKEIFATVTGSYDLLNHILSLGQDIAWRRFAVKKMCFFDTCRMLDVATGTADLGITVARCHPDTHITGLDFVREMVNVAHEKVRARHLSDRIRLMVADALFLPFPDSSFDVVAMAFGLRNIPDKVCALREMCRVVVPGGQVMVLELTLPRIRIFQRPYAVYLNRILPRLATAFSSNPGAYHYLGDSIMNFQTPEILAGLMKKAGLQRVRKYPLTLGVAHLHVGVKPAVF
ncbi:MAG: bifunctional demethylmenaquinone methyltransferase/2-methoxy-6-polyprenyl-1,4-benzoquinol methylase UbiE [Deltaproteobacteria bacterium]|nr:bifunctional demethylmenaquinone methyltransferase/2-methoxy-6-polyprenyl-1,4-benzoquinol methylase UbiE [Deltaproteobacteria bacterium]